MNETRLKQSRVYVPLAMFCCLLWSSAFPLIKLGYRLFEIDADDTAAQILFAGCRFCLAGILTILLTSISAKKPLIPKHKSTFVHIGILALVQTALHYTFFYLALAEIEGSAGSIINSAGSFLSVLAAALFFKSDRLNIWKILGCAAGFAGIIVLNIQSFRFGFHLGGEGLMLVAACFSAMSSVCIKRFSRSDNPALLCGWQFLCGGLLMAGTGLAMGGSLKAAAPTAWCILIALALISSIAYTLWSVLLKHNAVSKIAVFGFVNPVGGVMLCALVLHEVLHPLLSLVSLALVSAGIILVNRNGARVTNGNNE